MQTEGEREAWAEVAAQHMENGVLVEENDRLRAEIERLQTLLDQTLHAKIVNLGHSDQRVEQANQALIAELLAEIERLQLALYEIERMPFGHEAEVHAIASEALGNDRNVRHER